MDTEGSAGVWGERLDEKFQTKYCEIKEIVVNLIDFLLVLQRHGGGERREVMRWCEESCVKGWEVCDLAWSKKLSNLKTGYNTLKI